MMKKILFIPILMLVINCLITSAWVDHLPRKLGLGLGYPYLSLKYGLQKFPNSYGKRFSPILRPGLRMEPFSEENPAKSPGVAKKLTEHRLYGAQLDWSSQDKILYSSDEDGHFALRLMNSDGTGRRMVTGDENYAIWAPFQGSFSADGNKIAYLAISADLNSSILYLVNTDGSGQKKLYSVSLSIAWIEEVHFSPDQQKIAFTVDYRDRHWPDILAIINPDGTGFKELVAGIHVDSRFSWSPDSNKIAVAKNNGIYIIDISSSKPGELLTSNGYNPDWSSTNKIVYENHGIFSINPDGSGLTQLMTAGPEYWFEDPKWSPDGSKIALLNKYDDRIYIINADGSKIVKVGFGFSASWSPASDKISFTDYGNIFTINADGKNKQNLTNNTYPYAIFPGASESFPASYARGNKVIYYSFSSLGLENFELYSMNLDGTGKTKLVSWDRWEIVSYLSPDGSKVAYEKWMRGSPDELWIINTDGTNPKKIDTADYHFAALSWSPQSTRIAYVNSNQVFVTNADGTGKTLLGDSNSSAGLSWSPDGTKIVFRGLLGNTSGIYVINSDGTNKIKIADTDNRSNELVWSSNNKIYYVYNENIWRVNPDGTERKQLTFDGGNSPFPSPDGTKIIYIRERLSENDDVWIMDSDGSNKKNLSEKVVSIGWWDLWGGIDWRPDSQKIAFGGNDWSIYLINPDGSGLERISNPRLFTFAPCFSPDGTKLFYGSGFDIWVYDFLATGVGNISDKVTKLVNYPNPFFAKREKTKIRYHLKENSEVEIRIYDLIGDLVWEKKIPAGETPGGIAGPNEIEWDGKNDNEEYVGAGGYICLVKVGGKTLKRKIGVR